MDEKLYSKATNKQTHLVGEIDPNNEVIDGEKYGKN
jgi:hypothetical protein